MKEKKDVRVIKRYRNRKLYDTLDSCYVTLEDIADLVRDGEDICVIDNNTQEDLTGVTLAQIILEEERRKKDHLPLNTFIHLIRSGAETIRDFASKSLGDGVKEIHTVRDEILDHLENLVHRGSISRDEGYQLLGNIKSFIESKVKPAVENVQNIPSVQNEMKDLKLKLDSLEKKMNARQRKKKK